MAHVVVVVHDRSLRIVGMKICGNLSKPKDSGYSKEISQVGGLEDGKATRMWKRQDVDVLDIPHVKSHALR